MNILRSVRKIWETDPRVDPNPLVYAILGVAAILYPVWAQVSTGGQGDFLISVVADAGVYILLAIGLNVVVGFAGLLDLGYAAFFAIGAYTYAFLASDHLVVTQGVEIRINLRRSLTPDMLVVRTDAVEDNPS